MSRSAPSRRPRGAVRIARELCELFQQQIDALQQGLEEDNLEQYLERHAQIVECEAQLRALRRQPS
jgi:translation initiation factor 2B subunit (eIF-2B alpha/beta/delta family)